MGSTLNANSTSQVIQHLADFGLKRDVANAKIEQLSGGQRYTLNLFSAARRIGMNWMTPQVTAGACSGHVEQTAPSRTG
jgi:hypothetical protein